MRSHFSLNLLYVSKVFINFIEQLETSREREGPMMNTAVGH